ncbi:hypothetical protein FOE78_01740 [Microlunatus elymi]|uniref:Uncharacterized protein n=1 Tax=Microlunatus elymi TaxID=2596828 RepID=A0A516PUH7_9ACTN|nr:hypothetical protein [Microlunatus elymi]QDP94809.1 hypothetical protein FOE78_01740 [Microlunatus elymi]
MRRRDPLTYDLGDPHPTASTVSRPMILLLASILAIAALLVVWMLHAVNRTTTATDDNAPEAVASSASPSTEASASPAPLGSDEATAGIAPTGSQTATAEFVAAWLETNPTARKQALQRTATPGLAEQLMMTTQENIPDATPAGAPTLEHASTYSAQFVQNLTGDLSIRVYLAADPQSRNGWIATSVEQA